jgi:hypothetical protein
MSKHLHWTLNRRHYGSFRVFSTRAQARLYAKLHGFPVGAMVQTLAQVNSAIDDTTGQLYSVAPDGEWL